MLRLVRKLAGVASNDGIVAAIEAAAIGVGSLVFGHSRVYHAHNNLASMLFDASHRSDTGGRLALKSIGVDESAGRNYLATPPGVFRRMMSHLPITASEFTHLLDSFIAELPRGLAARVRALHFGRRTRA